MRIGLCLITWNEIDGCRHDIPRLPLDQFDDVYAVDNGSTDGTSEYLQSQGITVHRQSRRGYNQAYICAFDLCQSDALVLYHPKGTVDPSETLKARELLLAGNDLVIASRMIDGAQNEEDSRLFRFRKWFVLFLALIANLAWRRKGPMIWDVLHGFRGMRKDSFLKIDPLPYGLSIDLEMVARAYRLNLQAVEFPITERPRLSGATHFKAFSTGKKLMYYLWTELGRNS
jgi:glycosyltransferase involved in cell wall biosynthesis